MPRRGTARGFAAALTLFAFATILGWSCYGEKAFAYVTGGRGKLLYRLVFIAMVVVGAASELTLVWDVSDTLNGLMAIPNLIAVTLLGRQVKSMLPP